MQIISGFLPEVKEVVGFQEFDRNKKYKKSIFVVEEKIDSRNMIFNVFTRELIALDESEKKDFDEKNADCLEFYAKKWFYVPEDSDETGLVDKFRDKYRKSKIPEKLGKLYGYTILTTTDCNARCPYCYEKGIKKQTMDDSTARDVAEFILRSKRTGRINLHWFGGEPLVNQRAIDTICGVLQENHVLYSSFMVTNGYLIDTAGIDKIKNAWKMNRVQITLDGTEEIYNATKAYIHKGVSGFKKVVDNIWMLCESGIRVTLRLNLSDENYEDILALIDFISTEFDEFRGKTLGMYCHPLFDSSGEIHHVYEGEKTRMVYERLTNIHKRLVELGFASGYDVQKMKYHRCMADGHSSVVITPSGMLTLCEHCIEDHIIGTVWDNKCDADEICRWGDMLKFKECKSCFYYPQCYKLANCPVDPICSNAEREFNQYLTKCAMERIYKKSHASEWKRLIHPRWVKMGKV